MLRDNPRSNLLKFLPLQYLSGDKFHQVASKYIESQLRKGVPSLFANLKVLYKDESKKATLLQIVQGMHDSLKECGKFHSSSAGNRYFELVLRFQTRSPRPRTCGLCTILLSTTIRLATVP